MTGKQFADVLSRRVGEVARQYAAARGFDPTTESHGWMRAYLAVLSSPTLFAEARRRAAEELNQCQSSSQTPKTSDAASVPAG